MAQFPSKGKGLDDDDDDDDDDDTYKKFFDLFEFSVAILEKGLFDSFYF